MSRRSVDALWPELEDRKWLLRLGLAPQLERAQQDLTTFLLAISLDQFLDVRRLYRSITVWKTHADSVWEPKTPRCPVLNSARRLQQS
jgi:hypothetical protein